MGGGPDGSRAFFGVWSATRGSATPSGVRPNPARPIKKKSRKRKKKKRSNRGRSDKKVHTDKAGDNSNADCWERHRLMNNNKRPEGQEGKEGKEPKAERQ